ncbi:hypothetical protein [Litoribacter populi]|uniref:hypothetical protein n=1 Tax=Litoribacter populi TaxID=2598460 RepID=UPI00117EED48|nr:hypothetical protein [Litoribacter populi]
MDTRQQLLNLKSRCEAKLKSFYSWQKLPYDRIAKGRGIIANIDIALNYMNDGNEDGVERCLKELRDKGFEI